MASAAVLTLERLKELLHYDPMTGAFTWRVRRNGRGGGVRPGMAAGLIGHDRRRYIGVDGKRYAAHRLAWFYMTGEWPIEVDHRNVDALDNRWDNLREATRSQNNANVGLKSHNTSGLKGVSWDNARRLWKAQISVRCKRVMIGRFADKEEAAQAYACAAREAFGEFARA